MKKHIFVDMDGTVTKSKTPISRNMLNVLNKLEQDIIVISGASNTQMDSQLATLRGPRMSQSGNVTDLWLDTLSKGEICEIYAHMNILKNTCNPLFNWRRFDFIENRGCQVSLSFIGHNAEYKDKIKFDPDREKRLAALKRNPFNVKSLICKVAGTTCLDYTKKNGTKGKNIERYIKQMGWKKADCVYFGDALFKNGNDESVIGIIDTVDVSNPQDLLIKIKKYA